LDLKRRGKSLKDAVRLAVYSQAEFSGYDKKAVAQEGMIEFKNEEFIKEAFRKLLKTL